MSTNVMQCKECGRLFQSFGVKICPICAAEIESDFSVVKEYVYDHPEANVLKIVKETGVSEKRVLGFLREGRLSLDSQSDLFKCEKCGAPISKGRFCVSCQSKLESLLSSVAKHTDKIEKKEKNHIKRAARMHVEH